VGDLKVLTKTQEKSKQWASNNKDRKNAASRRYRINNPIKYIFQTTKSRAKKRGLEFDLTLDWLFDRIIDRVCPYTHFKFEVVIGSQSPYLPSIDRIDSSRGYTQDNCQVVSWVYNQAKSNYTDADMLVFAKAIVDVNNSKRLHEE